MRTIIKVVAVRRVNDQTSREARYFISSLDGDAKLMLKTVRSHWGIENSLHWMLDIAFDEDHQRVRKDNGPANFAVLRHIALNLLKQEKSVKAANKAKRLKDGWDRSPTCSKCFSGRPIKMQLPCCETQGVYKTNKERPLRLSPTGRVTHAAHLQGQWPATLKTPCCETVCRLTNTRTAGTLVTQLKINAKRL